MESQTTSARRGPKPKLDTRENLIRAGSKTFHQAGFGATGIKEIVDAAGVPKGSFYNHFESKEAFGKAVVDHYFAQGLERLRERLQEPGEEPLVRLRRFFDDHTLRFQNNGYTSGCMLGNMSLEIADHSDMIRESLSEHFATWSKLFEDCIQEAQLSGSVRNPLPAALIAEFLLNSWEGALLRMRAEQSDAPLKRFTEVVFTSVLV